MQNINLLAFIFKPFGTNNIAQKPADSIAAVLAAAHHVIMASHKDVHH